MGVVDDALIALFYGEGVWLGLLLYSALFIGLVIKWKLTGTFLIPAAGFISLEYLERNLTWPAAVMFCIMVFLFYIVGKELKGR